jgi:membrane protein implicated in regulation of membrane protease activity
MLVLALVEVATVNLVFIMFAAGAAAGAVAAYAGFGLAMQMIIAIIVSVLMLWLVRPFFLRHLRVSEKESRTNVDALVGASALTLERIDRRGGTIRLVGEVWTARTEEGEISPETDVTVVRIEGATAIVRSK